MKFAQERPGEWFLYSDHIPEPIPIPSWFASDVYQQAKIEDRADLVKLLGRIYGLGRRVGRQEGIEQAQLNMREALGL